MKEIKHLYYAQPDTLAEITNQATYAKICNVVKKYIPTGAKILDIGCGRGELLKLLSQEGYDVYGCDIDDQCVKMSKTYGKVKKIAVEEISREKFNGSFDCIIISHVLEHIENPLDAIMRLISISKKYLVISVPNPYYLPYILKSLFRMKIGYVNKGHLYSWDWFHLKTLIEVKCNQKVVKWIYDSVSLPVPRKLRTILQNVGVLQLIENKLLRVLLPRFCRSITALIRVEIVMQDR
jgi:SAM-dependent methyltransferase